MEHPLKQLGPRWTKQILERCTPRELLVVAAEYGIAQVATRMGYTDIQKFVEETRIEVLK
jgi:hypothetical protein